MQWPELFKPTEGGTDTVRIGERVPELRQARTLGLNYFAIFLSTDTTKHS